MHKRTYDMIHMVLVCHMSYHSLMLGYGYVFCTCMLYNRTGIVYLAML